MQLVHLILPSLATLALGSALLMPHREETPKRRKATIDAEAEATSLPMAEATSLPIAETANLPRAETANLPMAVAFERFVDQSRAFENRVVAGDATRSEASFTDHDETRNEIEIADHPESLARSVVSDSPFDDLGSESGTVRMKPPEDHGVREHATTEPATDSRREDASDGAGTPTSQASYSNSGGAECERVVPLTRHRLRRQTTSVAWPRLIDPSRAGCGPEERAALLRSIDTLTQDDVRDRVLLEALAEESGELRLAALRALAHSPPAAGAEAFAEILVHGTDEERALAIDALLAIEHREELVSAFGDRVEAIAAKAVFAYVGSRHRADYLDLLATRFERPRREAILMLLAGALE